METITSDADLGAILAFSLKSYKVLKNSKAKVHLSSKESLDECRTWLHTGIIDTDIITKYFLAYDRNFTTVDTSLLFYHDIRATLHFASIVDTITHKMRTLQIQDHSGNSIQKLIDALHLLIDNGTNKKLEVYCNLHQKLQLLKARRRQPILCCYLKKINMLHKFATDAR